MSTTASTKKSVEINIAPRWRDLSNLGWSKYVGNAHLEKAVTGSYLNQLLKLFQASEKANAYPGNWGLTELFDGHIASKSRKENKMYSNYDMLQPPKNKVFYHYVRLSWFGDTVPNGPAAEAHGGVTAVIDRKNNAIGVAVCSMQDVFEKSKGRKAAEMSLLKALMDPAPLKVDYPLVRDEFLQHAVKVCVAESIKLLWRLP
jgi:hypothetical protein